MKIWEHRDPSTFIVTEGLSGFGDTYSDSLIPSTTTTPSTPEPGLPPGPVVIVQRPPTPTKPTYREDPERVRAQSKWAEMMRTCPWNAEQRGAYDSLMYSGYLSAAQKQQLQGQAGRCIAASSATTRPVTRPLTGPSATIAAALARAQAQAALAAAAVAAGKATTQAISKLKPSGVSSPTAPAGGVSAAAKELAAKNQALREKMAKGAVEDAMKRRSLEDVQTGGAAVEAEIAALKKSGQSIYKGAPPPLEVGVDRELKKLGAQPTNRFEMSVMDRVDSEFQKEGFTPLTNAERAKVIVDGRTKTDVGLSSVARAVFSFDMSAVEKDIEKAIEPGMQAIAKSRFLHLTDELLDAKDAKNLGAKSGFKPDSDAIKFVGQWKPYVSAAQSAMKEFLGLGGPVPKNSWEAMKQNLHMANQMQKVATAGNVSPDFITDQIMDRAEQGGFGNKINGPAKAGIREVIKNAIQDVSSTLKKYPGLAGTAQEVLNTQADESVRMEAGNALNKMMNNFFMPAIHGAIKTQVEEGLGDFIQNIPKDVFEMQRDRAAALSKMDQLQNQIKAADRGWGEDTTLDIAALKSQYRLEKKNVDALGVRIEQVTADPRLSKYADARSYVRQWIR